MKNKIKALGPILLAMAILFTGCGKKNSNTPIDEGNQQVATPDISVSEFKDLGTLELTEPAHYDDGMLRFDYDGNFFLPAQLVSEDENFRELTIIQTDLRETEKNYVYGYIYHSSGIFGQDMDEIVSTEESYAFPNMTEEWNRAEYKTKTENYIGYTYEYIENDINQYAILVVKNETDLNGCFIGMVSSDMKEAIEKAKEMFETVEIYADEPIDSMLQASFARTEGIYDLLIPTTDTSSISEQYSEENILESVNKEADIAFAELAIDLVVGDKYTPELIGAEESSQLKFSSTDKDVATVDANGEITAISEGLTMIIVSTDKGDTAKLFVDVVETEGEL